MRKASSICHSFPTSSLIHPLHTGVVIWLVAKPTFTSWGKQGPFANYNNFFFKENIQNYLKLCEVVLNKSLYIGFHIHKGFGKRYK